MSAAARPLLFCDLDDTLFQTARKMREPPHPARLAAVATNGHDSYMTEAQANLVAWLLATTHAIPVTARSTAALARCQLPFNSWQVAANGAVILDPDGSTDPAWRERIAATAAQSGTQLSQLAAAMAEIDRSERFRHWIVEEEGMPIYFCVKANHDERDLHQVAPQLSTIAGPQLRRHHNGNNLSFTPTAISKRAAVVHLRERLAQRGQVVLGMGDSLTDLPFMSACEMMMIPAGSQIHTTMAEA